MVKVDNELGGTSGDEDATKDTLNYSLFYDNGKTKTRRAEKDVGGPRYGLHPRVGEREQTLNQR